MRSARTQTLVLGFTLIELLIVIAIVGILATASIPAFSSFTNSQRLSQAAKQVKNDLRSAQSRAINSVEGKAWGVQFATPNVYSYRIYTCSNLDTSQSPCVCSNQNFISTKNLATDFVLASGLFVFNQISGEVCSSSGAIPMGIPSSITLTLGTAWRTITVSAGGQITEQ